MGPHRQLLLQVTGKCKSEPELLGSRLPTSQVCVCVSESLVLWDLNTFSSEQAIIAASRSLTLLEPYPCTRLF